MNTNETKRETVYNRDDLAAMVSEAYRNYYAVRVVNMMEDAQKLVEILDALEVDLIAKMESCKNWDNLAYEYNDDGDIMAVVGSDPMKCFCAGESAYNYNPFQPDNKNESFYYACKYIAIDGYGRLCSISNRESLACWYDGNISDYLCGNYGDDLDDDALQELAKVFGGCYDSSEEVA